MKCEAFQLCVHRLRLVHSLGYWPRWTGRHHDAVVGYRRLDGKACGCRRGIRVYRIAVSQAAHLSRSGISGDGLPASGSRFACSSTHRSEVAMHTHSWTAPLLNVLAACLLLISFAMLSRRRTQRLITLFAWQGAILFLSTCLVAYSSGLSELTYSAALTLILKVIELH